MSKRNRLVRSVRRWLISDYSGMMHRVRKAIDRQDRQDRGRLWEGWSPREPRPTLIHNGRKP